MQLILMRHGLAVERDEWDGDDFQRPLTPAGRGKTRKAARGMAAFCKPPDLLATSPKMRALQTAEIVREELKAKWNTNIPLEEWRDLTSDHFVGWLNQLKHSKATSVWIVGHEPDLSRFASYSLAHKADKMQIEWKKAGAMALDLDWETGLATLLWMLPPRALRLLGK